MELKIYKYAARLKTKNISLDTLTGRIRFLQTIFKSIPIDIKTLKLEDYLLNTYSNISNKTYNNKVSILRSFYTFLNRYDYYDKNPAIGIEMKKVVFKAQRCFSDEEVLKIINSPRKLRRSRKEHEMYSLLFELCAYTGMRRSELRSIKIKDIFYDKSNPYIIIRETKNGDDRLVPIPINFDNKIKEYIQLYSPSIYLFESRNKKLLNKSSITKAFKRRLKQVDLYEPKTGLHALRRARISRLLMNHADLIGVMQLSGHKKSDTTIRYLYTNFNYLKEQANKDPLFNIDILNRQN